MSPSPSTARALAARAKRTARASTASARRSVQGHASAGLARGARALRRSPIPEPVRLAASRILLRRPRPLTVPVGNLLLGPQNARDFTAEEFADQTGDLLWASTPVADGPHSQLLRSAAAHETDLTDQDILESPYGQMALACIREQGRYFSATDAAGVVSVARSFIAGRGEGSARDGQPVLVAPIRGSDCYQVLDGHHRVARAAVAGQQETEVVAKWMPVTTPLQRLLRRMSWLEGDRQLYQPLDAPELRRSWPIVRRCTDRRDKMIAFLGEQGLLPPATTSYLDIASFYGWFVAQMAEQGYEAEGIERDPLGPVVGSAAYGVPTRAIRVGDCENLLLEADRTWDVVSCFSLLHHFVLGRGSIDHAELLRRIDAVTGRVLFFDTGQEHEAWFRTSLAGWDPERIRRTLLEHTSFDEVIDLGPDADAVPPHEQNYGRHLFACVRHVR